MVCRVEGFVPIEAAEPREPTPERGAMLAAISNTIVGIYKRLYGKGPTKARSYTSRTWWFASCVEA
jgi:hypothetical protein